jgi:tyrosine-protein kinase Etk/Wzc
MNARTPLATPQPASPMAASVDDDDGVDVIEYLDIVFDQRWLILAVTSLAIAIGAAYAFLARPVYEANLLIQVEDSGGSSLSFLGDAANNLAGVKTGVPAEIEIIRSRTILGQAVDNTLLDVEARPRYLPFVGRWLASRAHSLSTPGFLGLTGYVTGSEKIRVAAFTVPQPLEGAPLLVTAQGNGSFTISHPDLARAYTGKVGVPLTISTPSGTVSILVSVLEGKPGAEFEVVRRSHLAAIAQLQGSLKLAEKGRQSGMIDASMQSSDQRQLVQILNEIGRLYIRQNVERKAAEAQKMLAFLNVQLPQFKKQLEDAEETYTIYRKQQGTISFSEEASALLQRSIAVQSKLFEAQQKRTELMARFTAQHPMVKTFDEQVAALNGQAASLNAEIRALPAVQQQALRLERDVKVNNDAYQSLRNNQLQLQLVKEGKVGNVRMIDDAVPPEWPVSPNRPLILAAATLLGVLAGAALALARNALSRSVRNSQEIEAQTGIGVYATIPLSKHQEALAEAAVGKQPGVHLLAALVPDDPAIESLRSLRTGLQFAMIEARNNCVLITGATPGVGKSFISANFAALLASGGKRVLLIDADLRKGHLNGYFGTRRERGLSELVAGSVKIDEAIRRDVIPNLDLLTTGVLPPNPGELMLSAAFANVLQELSTRYDTVVLDTAPVLAAADTLAIASQVGTLLLVARAGQTQVGELVESQKRLDQAGTHVNGVIFNGIDLSRRYYGSYAYRYRGYKYKAYSYAPQK